MISLSKRNGQINPHTVTPENIMDSIWETTGELEMSNDERE